MLATMAFTIDFESPNGLLGLTYKASMPAWVSGRLTHFIRIVLRITRTRFVLDYSKTEVYQVEGF